MTGGGCQCCVCFLKENMSAFCVETQDRTLVFAALKDDCASWVEKLCHNTFKVGPLASPGSPSGPDSTSSTLSLCLSQKGVQPGSRQLCMEENQIYASADQGETFFPFHPLSFLSATYTPAPMHARTHATAFQCIRVEKNGVEKKSNICYLFRN